jgi:hypothetical protein
MSPQEHQLSQEVLEFLIAHQDWFMLDVPPEPNMDTSQPPSGEPAEPENFVLVPSSDEEYPNTGPSWKALGRNKRKLGRRRTEQGEFIVLFPSSFSS